MHASIKFIAATIAWCINHFKTIITEIYEHWTLNAEHIWHVQFICCLPFKKKKKKMVTVIEGGSECRWRYWKSHGNDYRHYCETKTEKNKAMKKRREKKKCRQGPTLQWFSVQLNRTFSNVIASYSDNGNHVLLFLIHSLMLSLQLLNERKTKSKKQIPILTLDFIKSWNWMNTNETLSKFISNHQCQTRHQSKIIYETK